MKSGEQKRRLNSEAIYGSSLKRNPISSTFRTRRQTRNSRRKFSTRWAHSCSTNMPKYGALPRLAEFEFNLRQTQAAIPRAEENVRNLESQLRSTQPRITTELRNSDNAVLMQQLKSSLVNLELQHTDLIQKYAPDDRQVKEVEEQIGQVKN